jgi:lysozyme family protein
MAEFKTAFQKMLAHEGGYVNDPNDQGGETYKGISRNAHKNWSGWAIIDKYKSKPDFPASLEKNLELSKLIQQFYLTNFWTPLNADLIANQTNGDSVFDFAVNTGITTTARIVQSLVGTKIDGIIGEITINKINSMDFGHFQAAFTVTKIEYYMTIIRNRPANKKYLVGWITRTLEYNE